MQTRPQAPTGADHAAGNGSAAGRCQAGGQETVAVIGLGYVGLPLLTAFGRSGRAIGYDVDPARVAACARGEDPSQALAPEAMREAAHAEYTADPGRLREARMLIVAVPTPVDAANVPDFSPLVGASIAVGRNLQPGATVIYESTVYPGATEEVCVPILERESGLVWKRDFFVGYSPERINPGDPEHTLATIRKVVAGDTPATLERVAALYERVVTAGVHRTSSIAAAEAAKVIENTQRDINIALINELAIIFHRLGLDTNEVLAAAGSKWNFLPFRPGLVGGHCIGVDPYYLTHKAVTLGYHPQVILAGRRINDGMAAWVAQQVVRELIANGSTVKGARVIVLGLTFKANCPDLRNSKNAELVRELAGYGCEVTVHDPQASPGEARREYGVELVALADLPRAVDAVVLAVAHREFLGRPARDFLASLRPGGLCVDLQSAWDAITIRDAGFRLWRL